MRYVYCNNYNVAKFQARESIRMIQIALKRSVIATLLGIALVLSSFGFSAFGQRRYYRRYHHHSKTKGALIGGAAGAVGGALIGGGKGALIGGGAGAGTGALVQHYRNKHHHHRRRY
jgi:hypothetical protein